MPLIDDNTSKYLRIAARFQILPIFLLTVVSGVGAFLMAKDLLKHGNPRYITFGEVDIFIIPISLIFLTGIVSLFNLFNLLGAKGMPLWRMIRISLLPWITLVLYTLFTTFSLLYRI